MFNQKNVDSIFIYRSDQPSLLYLTKKKVYIELNFVLLSYLFIYLFIIYIYIRITLNKVKVMIFKYSNMNEYLSIYKKKREINQN
jgi:hypothetical protein